MRINLFKLNIKNHIPKEELLLAELFFLLKIEPDYPVCYLISLIARGYLFLTF